MGYIYDDWKQLLETFQQCVEKDLEEIHQQKAEVQQIKTDIFDRLNKGLYYRDGDRIVISAPEIVIGNVDKSGDLIGEGGSVIVKGRSVGLEGVGEEGSVTTRAASIRQTAVNPGIDGQENVVCTTSEIVSQACSIVMHSSDAEDAFSADNLATRRGGVWIHADNSLDLEAAVSNDQRKAAIEAQIGDLTTQASNITKDMNGYKKTVDAFFTKLNKLNAEEDKLNDYDGFAVRLNINELDLIHNEIQSLLPSLHESTISFMRCVSQLAEVNRKKKALQQEKDDLLDSDAFKSDATGAAMNISAETINVATTDGDGNLHTNLEAGINVRTPRMGVSMSGDDGKLVADGSLSVNSQSISLSTAGITDDNKGIQPQGTVTILSKDINLSAIDYAAGEKAIQEKQLTEGGSISLTAKNVQLSTANPKGVERDEKGALSKGEFTGDGSVVIMSKTIAMESLDYEVADGKLKTKALTKDSQLAVRTEKMNFLAADAEGKATGSISANAKAISVKSMDVDKEKLTDTALAAGSTMTVVSEKMYLGAASKDVKSKKLQAVSEEMGLFADKTFEAQQGEGKAVVQLADGNAAVGGSKTQVYGDTTINAKTEVKGELKGPKGTFDAVEAKSALKSPNISDGMAAGAGGGGGSLSAKLKSEDAPKE